MKVLHIATTDAGGAGKGMINQHLALLNLGIDSRILVAYKKTRLKSVVEAKPNLHYYNSIIRFFFRALKKIGICFFSFDKYSRTIDKLHTKSEIFYTCPFSLYDLSTNSLVKEADVINLHWVSNFLDYPTFFEKVDKPIVITMRDENFGLGGFHYTKDKEQWYSLYKELEDFFLETKKNALGKCINLHIVSLSKVMADFCNHSDFLSKIPNQIIYNAINPKEFILINHQEAKCQLGFKEDDFIISFVSVNINEKRKGLTKILEAIERINNPYIRLLCVGEGTVDNSCAKLMGIISDSKEMSKIYSASDVFISASLEESFGKTVVEAMFCGCPVISTPAGVSQEIINSDNGILCQNGTVDEFVQAIRTVMGNSYYRQNIRNNAVELFAPHHIATQYYNLYKKISSK